MPSSLTNYPAGWALTLTRQNSMVTPNTSVFAGALGLYSVRVAAGNPYQGPLVRVRRSSDNAERDFYALPTVDTNGNKWLDTASLLTWVGAGNSGFVSLWYDQSGNAFPMRQATAAIQPRIVNAGVLDTSGGIVALAGTGAAVMQVRTGGTTGTPSMPWTQNITINCVMTKGAGATTVYVAGVDRNNSGFRDLEILLQTNTISLAHNLVPMTPTTTLTDSSRAVVTGIRFPTGSSPRGLLAVNGVTTNLTTESAATDLDTNNMAIFADPDGSGLGNPSNWMPAGWALQEVAFWGSGNSPASRTALERSQGVAFATIPFSGAAAAYSVRTPFSSSYNGPLLRVRRSSDNAEQDIFASSTVDSNGNRFLDTVALLAFVGAGSGFIRTWYDQSGNGRDATQTTVASQPRIVNAGVLEVIGSSPTLNFLGTAQLAFSGLTTTQTTTVGAVVRANNPVGQPASIVAGATGAPQLRIDRPATSTYNLVLNRQGQVVLLSGAMNVAVASTGSVLSFVTSATQYTSFQNGTTIAGPTTANPSFSQPITHIGATSFMTEILNGSLSEVLIFTGAVDSANVWRNQGAAFGITVV